MDKQDKQTTEEPKKEEVQQPEKAKEPEASKEPEAIQEPEVKKPEKPKGPKEPKLPKKEVKVSGKLKNIIAEIEKLTVLELADLVKALEEKFGVSAVPMAASAAVPAAAGGQPGQAGNEEKTIFNVVLTQTGAQKIQVIKALRLIKPDLGLQETKKITESVPEQILTEVNKKQAEEAKKKLEEAGATVELK